METTRLEQWRLYCPVCTMYVMPGRKTCDYCHGPLIERPRKITEGAGDSIIAANGSRTVASQ